MSFFALYSVFQMITCLSDFLPLLISCAPQTVNTTLRHLDQLALQAQLDKETRLCVRGVCFCVCGCNWCAGAAGLALQEWMECCFTHTHTNTHTAQMNHILKYSLSPIFTQSSLFLTFLCYHNTDRSCHILFINFVLKWDGRTFHPFRLSALTLWEWVVVDVCRILERGSVQLESKTAIVKLKYVFPTIKKLQPELSVMH